MTTPVDGLSRMICGGADGPPVTVFVLGSEMSSVPAFSTAIPPSCAHPRLLTTDCAPFAVFTAITYAPPPSAESHELHAAV